MSGDTPKWMEELSQELGLADTPIPTESDRVISLLELIKSIEFTKQGWARVKELIISASEHAPTELFQRIINENDGDLMMFTAMVAIPYWLARTLNYNEADCERLISYVAASYVIAMSRGYERGSRDSFEERRTRDE